jgi:Leucine-rich repeat (LRR) protein
VDLSFNALTGSIRDNFGLFEQLTHFDVSNNQLTGVIPASLFDVPTIRLLYLARNQLFGPIPSNYGSAMSLRDLYIQGNQLQGTVPPISAGGLASLTEFLLHDNNIEGQMPASVCALLSTRALEDLWADCDVGGLIECSCCTQCSNFPL